MILHRLETFRTILIESLSLDNSLKFNFPSQNSIAKWVKIFVCTLWLVKGSPILYNTCINCYRGIPWNLSVAKLETNYPRPKQCRLAYWNVAIYTESSVVSISNASWKKCFAQIIHACFIRAIYFFIIKISFKRHLKLMWQQE